MVVIAAAVVVLGLSVHHAYSETTQIRNSASVSSWITFASQEQCILHSIRADLPEGATVYVHDASAYDAALLEELSTPWVQLENKRGDAQWSVTLVNGSKCSGDTVDYQKT